MAEGTVEERVIKVFADFKKISPDEIKSDTTFEEMGLDSLDGLNLIFELEEEFNITVPDDKVQEMKSIKEVVAGVQYLIDNPYDASAEAQKMMEREIAARKAAADAKLAEEEADDADTPAETAEEAKTTEAPETAETPGLAGIADQTAKISETAETLETAESAESAEPAEDAGADVDPPSPDVEKPAGS
jgi:acyl carrier protein